MITWDWNECVQAIGRGESYRPTGRRALCVCAVCGATVFCKTFAKFAEQGANIRNETLLLPQTKVSYRPNRLRRLTAPRAEKFRG